MIKLKGAKMSNVLKEDFVQYMTKKYGAKGRRSIRFADRVDEVDILLGVKDATDFDEEDKKFLSQEQLDEIERLGNKLKGMREDMERDMRKYI
jgi:hypothetical protein